MGVFDFFRSAPEVAGPNAIDELEKQIEALSEASYLDQAANKMVERRLEDLTYRFFDMAASNSDDLPDNRRRIIRRAYRYWAEDPIVGQALNLLTWYTFGRGAPMPTIPDYVEMDEEQRNGAQNAIKKFWNAPENQATICTLQAQEQKSLELQIEGEVFIAMFDGDDGLVLSDIDPIEISNVIVSTDNRKMPLYYERTYYPVKYDFKTRAYQPTNKKIVKYYQHWRNQPGRNDPKPPASLLETSAKIMHVSVNHTSNQTRGNSEVRRILEWAKGFREFMESRLAVAREINRLARVVKVDGGPTELAKVISQFKASDPLNLTQVPLFDPQIASPQAATMFRTPNVSIEPNSFETGAGVAQTDKSSFLGQIAAGTGWPSHYLGGDGSSSLANMTAMELPILKMVEARQELWEGVIRNVTTEALRRAGFDDIEPEVNMPPILQRDTSALAGALQAMVAVIDPQQENMSLKRWATGQFLSLFAENNVQERTNEIVNEAINLLEDQAEAESAVAAQQAQTAGQMQADAQAPTTNEDKPNLAVPDGVNRQTNSTRMGQTPYGSPSAETMAKTVADPNRTAPREQ